MQSSDANRYLLKDSQRYSHILDLLTGWPIVTAPASVVVLAFTSTQAAMLAIFASLEGADAEPFLQQHPARIWAERDKA